MSWDAPSCLTNNGWCKPPGAPMEQATGMRSCHFLTPETETSCHYHFAAMRWQPIRRGPEEEAVVMKAMADIRQRVFVEEDSAIITAQQSRIREAIAGDEGLDPVLLSIDAGVERAHRILRDLYQQEQRAAEQAPA